MHHRVSNQQRLAARVREQSAHEVFILEAVRAGEALLDAMSCWVAGVRHVTAAYGVNGWTDDHDAALRTWQARDVFVAHTADVAEGWNGPVPAGASEFVEYLSESFVETDAAAVGVE